MNIWARFDTGKVEKIDTCAAKEAAQLVQEYQIAFGKSAHVWAGRKKDEFGKPCNKYPDETAHYRCLL